jgi:hypothetical protein
MNSILFSDEIVWAVISTSVLLFLVNKFIFELLPKFRANRRSSLRLQEPGKATTNGMNAKPSAKQMYVHEPFAILMTIVGGCSFVVATSDEPLTSAALGAMFFAFASYKTFSWHQKFKAFKKNKTQVCVSDFPCSVELHETTPSPLRGTTKELIVFLGLMFVFSTNAILSIWTFLHKN